METTTRVSTEENNKIIAEFMGVIPTSTKYTKNWYDGHELSEAGLPFSCGAMGNGTSELKFHTSWDWLMPVVRKIVEISCNESDDAFLSDHYTSILETIPLAIIEDSHKVVVEFINWYNKNLIK